ncbi:MAG: bifunctional 4'-phosphopantothenoylcysteine decarboxylase/phosphopantothenoylcysteine synthetase, partial [Sedimenticola sp.]|nr:bifunctional 4'-phosphopantothenoylcysteine decarboxylase/phosphopantothenoylcysteine synthetase [Sedimenticola sp.]
SSGKMGFALASAFREAGASVELVAGPVTLQTPPGVERTDVETALEMEQAVMTRVAGCDIFVGCAAVADFRPQKVAGQKIKKSGDNPEMDVHLVRNPDILAGVAARPDAPFSVGFAAETEAAEDYAEKKRVAKGVNMIAANLVGSDQGGFERDENALTLLWEGGRRSLPMADKGVLARQLVSLIAEHYEKRDSA